MGRLKKEVENMKTLALLFLFFYVAGIFIAAAFFDKTSDKIGFTALALTIGLVIIYELAKYA